MEKKDRLWYEKKYISKLEKMNALKNDDELEEARDDLNEFKNNGFYASSKAGSLSKEEFFESENNKNYRKFVTKNASHMDEVIDGNKSAEKEVKRVKRKIVFRRFVKVVGGIAIVGLIAYGVHSCSKNKNNTKVIAIGETTPTTTYATEGETTSTVVTETASVVTENTEPNEPTTSYDESGVIPSISGDMSGIVIGEPTTTNETTIPTTNGTTTPTTNGTTTPTTKPTEGTEPTYTTLPTEPSIPSETTIPTTKPTEPTTNPSYEPGPSGMPVDPTGEPEPTTTYTTFPTEPTIVEPSEPTTKPSDETGPSGMPIETGGPTETTETYFTIPGTSTNVEAPSEGLYYDGMIIDEVSYYGYRTEIPFKTKTNPLNTKRLVLTRK